MQHISEDARENQYTLEYESKQLHVSDFYKTQINFKMLLTYM